MWEFQGSPELQITVEPPTSVYLPQPTYLSLRCYSSDLHNRTQHACYDQTFPTQSRRQQRCRRYVWNRLQACVPLPQPWAASGFSVMHSSFTDVDQGTGPRLIPSPTGLLGGIIRAYQQGLHLVFRPDDVWLAITPGPSCGQGYGKVHSFPNAIDCWYGRHEYC